MWHPRAATTTIDGADIPLQAAGRGALRFTSPTALVAALVVAIALVCRFALGVDLTPGTALAGLLVGTLVGMTGMGSGALMAPILILLIGVAPVTAVGTDLAYASITKLVGSLQHHRQRTVDFGLARALAFGSVPGALVAVEALDWLRGRYPIETINALLLRSLGFTLTLSAVALWLAMLRRRQQRRGGGLPTGASLATWKAIAIGAPVGFLVGLTSVGSGSIFVVLLSFLTPLAAPVIVGTDIAHATILTAAAGAAHGAAGNVDPRLLLNLLAGSLPGVVIGSRLSVRVSETMLRTTLGLVLLATGLKLL